MNQEELKRELDKLNKAQFQLIASNLGYRIVTKTTKGKLAELIKSSPKVEKMTVEEFRRLYEPAVGTQTPTRQEPEGNSLFTTPNLIGLAGLLVTVLALVYQLRDMALKPMPVDLMWYELKNNVPQLLTGDQIRVTMDDAAFKARTLQLPVNLAIRNRSDDVLEVVSVQISYPKWLKVQSQGRGRIDPDGGRIVYAHQIALLPPVQEFTPLETIDVLSIPFPVEVTPVLVKLPDGVPFHYWTLTGAAQHELEGKELKLRVRVDCKGRIPLTTDLNLRMPVVVDIAGSKRKPPVRELVPRADSDRIAALVRQAGLTLDQWSETYVVDGSKIEYAKQKSGTATLQVVRVDGVVRRVNVDQDSDGKCEADYMDTDSDGTFDRRETYNPPEPMVDWVRESTNPVAERGS